MTDKTTISEEKMENKELKEEILKQSLKVLKTLPAMGPVLLLYLQSSHRRFHFISDLEWLLLPPLVSGQCKLYMKNKYPISFVSWAFLDKDAEARLLHNGGKLRPEDWNSGDRLWLIDIIAPFGSVENMLSDIQKNEFPENTIHLIVPDPKTGGITSRKLSPLKKKQQEMEKQGQIH